jgi:hypothetical protein
MMLDRTVTEQWLVAHCFQHPDAAGRLLAATPPRLFRDPRARAVAEWIAQRLLTGEAWDFPRLLEHPETQPWLPDVMRWIQETQEYVTLPDTLAAQIRRAAWREQAEDTLQAGLRAVREGDTGAVEGVIAALQALAAPTGPTLQDASTGFHRLWGWLQDQQSPDHRRTWPTPWPAVNSVTGGFAAPELILLGGRPGMGKTSLALQCAVEVARRSGQPVLVVSYEMGPVEVWGQVAAQQWQLDRFRVSRGVLTRAEWDTLALGRPVGAAWPVVVWDGPGPALGELVAAGVQGWQGRPWALVIVDYIGLIPLPGRTNRAQELGEVGRVLKDLGRRAGVPVLALASLNREVEGRNDKAPIMSDLRDSGELEHHADQIWMLGPVDPHTRRLYVRKHRGGPTGDIDLVWEPAWSRYALPREGSA